MQGRSEKAGGGGGGMAQRAQQDHHTKGEGAGAGAGGQYSPGVAPRLHGLHSFREAEAGLSGKPHF